MKTEDMPALPEPAVWRARGQIWSLSELHRQGLIDEADRLFSAEQVISYAAQAVAAERERCENLLELQQASYEREIQIEVAAERERCARLCENLRVIGREADKFDCAHAIRELA